MSTTAVTTQKTASTAAIVALAVKVVCRKYNLTEELLKTSPPQLPLIMPRYISWYIIKESTGLKNSDIGKLFNTDRNKVWYGIKALKEWMLIDTGLKALAEEALNHCSNPALIVEGAAVDTVAEEINVGKGKRKRDRGVVGAGIYGRVRLTARNRKASFSHSTTQVFK